MEKAHGAGSIVKSYHLRLSPTMLAHRALLAQAAPLFSAPKAAAQEARLHRRIDSLRAKPVRYSAMNEYCSKLITKVCAGRPVDDPELQALQANCIATHVAHYAALPMVEKRQLQQAAEAERDRRQDEQARRLEADLASLLQRHALQDGDSSRELTSIVSHSVPNKISSMAFDEEAKARICRSFHAMKNIGAHLAAAEREILEPGAPPPHLCALVEAKAATFPKQAKASPWWAGIVARERDRFHSTALVPIDPDQEVLVELPDRLWYITVMSQKRVDIELLEVTRDTSCPALEVLAAHEVPAHFGLATYSHDFKYCSACEVASLASEDARFGVVHASWVASGSLCIISEFQEFHAYIAAFASVQRPVRAPRQASHRRPSDAVLAALVESFPWLSQDDILEYLESRPSAVPGPRHGSRLAAPLAVVAAEPLDKGPEKEVTAVVEAVAAAMLDDLKEKRDLHETADDKAQYFYLKLPGGLWTATHKGVPTDCAACLNRRMTEDFCIRYGFPRKKSFMFSVYGEYSAVQLATEWTRRGMFRLVVECRGILGVHILRG